jgi:hypothetical protein
MDDVLDEYAVRFSMLIEQAERIDAIDTLREINVASYTQQKAPYQRKVVKSLEKLAYGKVTATPAIIKKDSQRLMSILGIKQQQ